MSGKNARAHRRQGHATESTELHVLAALFQWWILPAGACSECAVANGSPRTLVTIMGRIPTRDMIPGNVADEAASDARFQRLAAQQREGQYETGGVYALCQTCAAARIATTPDDLGLTLNFARLAFPVSATDALFMHGEPGPDKPVSFSIRSGAAGEVLPLLEKECLQFAIGALPNLPIIAYEREGGAQ